MENYIGPYWSNGQWQESVEFGDKDPQSEVDAAARLHDSAYAHFKDEAHRTAADEIFSSTLKKLRGKNSQLADVPLYGNYLKNRLVDLGSDVSTGFRVGGIIGGLGALVYNGVKGIVRSNDLIHNGAKYRKDVLDYYATDTKPAIQTTQVQQKQKPTVSLPKPIAPLQNTTIKQEEMFTKKKNIVAPSPEPTNVREIEVRPARQTPRTELYKPLKQKRSRVTPGDLLKWLEYHPGQEAKIRLWLDKNQL